jgi:hypothetical protein
MYTYCIHMHICIYIGICIPIPIPIPIPIVPNIGVGRCLGPEGNGVSSGEGGEGGPGPPSRERDKQSTPSKEGGNMEQEEERRTSQA